MKSAQCLLAVSGLVLGLLGSAQPARAEVLVLPGEQVEPKTTLKIVDARPPEQRSSEEVGFSSLVTSCSYGIIRLADTATSPHKLTLLRADLEKALGSRLDGKTLTVWSYALYSNASRYMRGASLFGAFGAIGGLIGATSNPNVGSGCTADETPEGWFDPAEAKGQTTGFVAQIGVRMDGKDYAVRTMSWPGATRAQIFADLLHRANASLAAKMGASDAPVAAAVNSDAPFGIKSAATVTSESITSIYFANDPHGVAVGALEPKGAAAEAGIQVGDVITALNGKRVTAFDDVKAAASGSDVKAEINRSGHVMTVQVHP